MTTRPKPIIQKLEFSAEDQADINALLEGRPTKQSIENQRNRGIDVDLWLNNRIKYHTPPPLKQRLRTITQRYKISICCVCRNFPNYKITYKLPDVVVVDWYCQQHFKESGIE